MESTADAAAPGAGAAGSTSSSAATAAPPKPEVKSWADEADEEDDKAPPPSSDDKAEDLKKMEALRIREEAAAAAAGSEEAKAGLGEGLDEPDDSAIRAVTSGDTVYTSALSFEDLNLSKELIQGLYVEMGFKRPSKIQALSLPMILTPPHKNLVAKAHNGSGKTTCFVLGMLSRVDPQKKLPQALCICPTRVLAQQNEAVLLRMGKYTGITSICAIPTDSVHYIPIMKREPITEQVVIGTPGTIKKWVSAKKLSTREMKILVFDEADHMLAEDGFRDDSERIMKEIERNSPKCQVLLFSATFNETVTAFVSRVVKDANQLYVEKVKQYKVNCPDELSKVEVIKDKIFEFGEKDGQTIIFVRTRHSASMLHETLLSEGYECTSILGAIEQSDIDKIIKEFKNGLTKVLITTDHLTRGFDQAQVNLVVNYDLPVKHDSQEPDYEVCLHRIGRTGRFGRKGNWCKVCTPAREGNQETTCGPLLPRSHTAMADTKSIKLKLLVDKEKNKVVLAESGRDFVDLLLSFLTLPVGTVVRLLNKQSLLGCMDKLYKSVEKLNLQFMQTKACKTMLLRPRSPAERACEDLKLHIDDTKPRIVYWCPRRGCTSKTSRLYSPTEDAKCPCGLPMDKVLVGTKKVTRESGVFVKGEGSFTVSEDLQVTPTSMKATLSVLHKFGVKDCTGLEEMIFEIGKEEVLNLLRQSLSSDTPLTDVFLRKLDPHEDAHRAKKDQMPIISIKHEADITETKNLKMKLLLSKSRNSVLYAEAGGDVVDFLFSFLTFPVGSMIKLLDKCSSVICLDNLYKSTEELINSSDHSVDADMSANMLLSPKLAPMFNCSSQLLRIEETVSFTATLQGCQDCHKSKSSVAGTKCAHGIEQVTLTAINPKLPSSGTESGGGFTKGGELFMITDELEVTPVSSISSIHVVGRSRIPVGDLVVREVSVGEHEALNILKASLISNRALSDVFCHR